MPEKTIPQQILDARAAELAGWAASLCGEARCGELKLVSADASSRRYFRYSSLPGIFADMPHGENPVAFAAIGARLDRCGLHVPRVQAMDVTKGFFWLTDLGDTPYLYAAEDKLQLYTDAVKALLHMQRNVNCQSLPPYGRTLLMSEMHLFRDWTLRSWLGLHLAAKLQNRLEQVFGELCEAALAQPQLFVHRDYHSRNLMYCPAKNPGILDFQDAVQGPYSYDLVSLLKDCYVRIDNDLRESLCQLYVTQAELMGILTVKKSQFQLDFDLMGVQRHLKAAGIFARLYLRDGKRSYLLEIPRTLSYITELHGCHPELDWLSQWLASDVVPQVEAKL